MNLRSLVQTWSKDIIFPVVMSRLEKLFLSKFSPGERGLAELPDCPVLTELGLSKFRVRSLSGIEKFSKLKFLYLIDSRDLHSVRDIRGMGYFDELYIENCPAVSDFGQCFSAGLDVRKIVFMKNHALQSIDFILDIPSLESVVFMNTDVVDGDMRPLFLHPGIRHVAFTRKKHFSHSDREVNQQLMMRGRQDNGL